MVRWLEANGYDVTLHRGRRCRSRTPALLRNHRVFLSVGHDEYWSAGQRANVEAARDAGVHLAFFSGNEVFWKTRWENSIDGSGTPYRTLVSYKETHANAKIDPTPAWTGTWRDPRFSPPADGGRPENALTGTIFKVQLRSTGGDIIVFRPPNGNLRLWRNTASPPSRQARSPRCRGHAGLRVGRGRGQRLPAGRTVPPVIDRHHRRPLLQDYGSTYGTGTAHASLTSCTSTPAARWCSARAPSTGPGAWTAITIRAPGWRQPDVRMQQATVNLFADMNAQPGTLQAGLVAVTASTDSAAPTVGDHVADRGCQRRGQRAFTITGTAADTGGGVVGGVEVSTDGGTTGIRPRAATRGRTAGRRRPRARRRSASRAIDDSGNIQGTPTSVNVTVGSGGDTTPPTITARTPASGATGVAATSDVTVTFNEAMDPGSIGSSSFELRDSANALVAASVSYNAATRVATLNPTPTLAGLATYTARVRGGATDPRVKDAAGNALAADSLWSFTTASTDTTPPTITASTPASGANGVAQSTNVTVTFSEAMDAATIGTGTVELRDSARCAGRSSGQLRRGHARGHARPDTDAGALATVLGTGARRRHRSAGQGRRGQRTGCRFDVELHHRWRRHDGADHHGARARCGATGVAPDSDVTVTFNEAMDASITAPAPSSCATRQRAGCGRGELQRDHAGRHAQSDADTCGRRRPTRCGVRGGAAIRG